MNLIKKFIHLIVIPFSVGVPITVSLPRLVIAEPPVKPKFQSQLISQSFIPPNRKAPQTTAGGGSRGDACDLGSKEILQPLIPVNKFGLTLAERPTFYWFVQQTRVQTAHFSILDEKGIVYTTTVKLPNKAGITGFTLPNNAPSLKIGKQYHWYFAIACNTEESEKELIVDGWVERIQATPALSKQLARTNPRQLSQVYANAGIWHEALHILIKNRLVDPSDTKLSANWQAFLESVGLKNLVSQPLIKYMQNIQTSQENQQCECKKE